MREEPKNGSKYVNTRSRRLLPGRVQDWIESLNDLPYLTAMFEPLPRAFYRPSAAKVAPALLGKWLIRNTPAGPCGGPIVETEAYVQGDPACHAFCGPTARNRVMWGHPGVAYVYLIYGNHFCVNAVCCPEGTAEAVLIRAIEAAQGQEWMFRQRPVVRPEE